MIQVMRGSVKINGEKYIVGAIIKGLSKNDEARLVEKGIAKYADGEKQQPEANKRNDKKAKQEIPDEEDNEELVDQADGNITFNPDDYIEDANPNRKKSGKTGR